MCSKRTPGKSAHLRLASTKRGLSGVDRNHGVAARSKRSGQNADRAAHFKRRTIAGLRHGVERDLVFASLVWTRREFPGIGIRRVERVKILGPECLARSRSCVAFKEEFIRKIEMGQVDLAEEKSAGIVVDERRCLRAVRGDGATLLLHRLVIDADPEPATDWINLSRGWERMSPDDILEQSDFPDATLNLACDLVGRLVVAMWIVSPADKKGSRSNFPHAVSDDADRAFGLFALIRNKTIGETEEKHLLRFQPKLRARLSCLLLAE